MSKTVSLKRNFIMNAILTASSFLFPLITFPYVSRVLLPEGNGRIAFATSIVSYFSMFSSLGIPTYGIRACAQVRDNQEELSRTAQEIFIINAITSVIVYTIFLIVINIVPRFQSERILFLILGSTILFNLLGMEWFYQALEQYQYITVRSLLFKCISIILMFLLVHSKEDYVIYGGITIFAGVGSNILNFFNVRHYISVKPLRPYGLFRHFKPILTFFALSVATTIYTNLDIAMLGFISGDMEVGYYNSAIKIKIILTSFVTSLGSVLLPRVSYYVENNLTEEYTKLIQKAFQFVTLSAISLCVYFILMANESILFLSGKAYERSVIPMQFIMPTILFIGLTNIIGIQLLVPLGKEKLVVFSTCIGAIVDVVLNIIFIPHYAAAGAAIGTVTAEFVVFLVQLWLIRTKSANLFSSCQIFKILAAIFVAILALTFIRRLPIPSTFLILMATGLVFFATYAVTLLLLHYRLDLH